MVTVGEIGRIKFKPSRSRGADGDGARKDPAVPAGCPNIQSGGAGASNTPIHGLGAITHAGTGARDIDDIAAGVLHVHQERRSCPEIESLFAAASVATVPIDTPLESDGIAYVKIRERANGGSRRARATVGVKTKGFGTHSLNSSGSRIS